MSRSIRILAAVAMSAALVAPASAEPTSPGWHLVSSEGRITGAGQRALEASGASALQYVPESSYLAWVTDPGRVSALPAVSSVRPLEASEKVDPSLRGRRSGSLLVTAVVYGPALRATLPVLSGLGTVLDTRLGQPDGMLREAVLVTTPALLDRIAALDAVASVSTAPVRLTPEDEASAQIQAGNLNSGGTAPVTGYGAWLQSLGLDGSGVRVSIVDTGVDETHPDLQGRIVSKVEYSSTATGEPIDSGGHGTHVAGITGGAGFAFPVHGPVRDSGGFAYGMGVAPKVEMVDQNAIATTYGGLPPAGGFQRMSKDAVVAGSSAWNASWHSGEGTGIGYIQSARTMDIMVRDANWDAAGAEPFTLVFSAGNGSTASSQTSTMTAPKESKNMISVANGYSHRAGNITTISSSSSRGPARDGRILPTITAPGSSIMSSRSLTPATSCNTPTTDGLGLYASCSGTSMAAPHVTGAVALATQWWKRANGGASPSPAMLKALLINSAQDIGIADIPNKNEGWGRVHLGSLFDKDAARIYVDQSRVFTELDETLTYTVGAADPAKPLKVSLVWSDAPGAGSGGTTKALVNDLDLTVTASDGTATYFGNRFAQGFSIPDGSADRKNNLENVFIKQPNGTYTVQIRAFDLPGDGVPFSGDETDQDFALVISNAVQVAQG